MHLDDFKSVLCYYFACWGVATFVYCIADLIHDGVKLRKKRKTLKEQIQRTNGMLSVLSEKQKKEVQDNAIERGIDLELLRKQGVEI